MSALYDRDFYAWSQEQALLLRAGKLSGADLEHIAEEIESLGKTEKRELISQLAVLLVHLLKWQYQPVRRGASWEATIRIQRRGLRRHMTDNPSLKSVLPEVIADADGDAIIAAERETDLDRAAFPKACPWSFEQMMDDELWPEA